MTSQSPFQKKTINKTLTYAALLLARKDKECGYYKDVEMTSDVAVRIKTLIDGGSGRSEPCNKDEAKEIKDAITTETIARAFDSIVSIQKETDFRINSETNRAREHNLSRNFVYGLTQFKMGLREVWQTTLDKVANKYPKIAYYAHKAGIEETHTARLN